MERQVKLIVVLILLGFSVFVIVGLFVLNVYSPAGASTTLENPNIKFAPNIRVSEVELRGRQYSPFLSVDSVGNVFVVWVESHHHSRSDIYIAKSTDNGKFYGTNVRVTESETNVELGRRSMTVDKEGNVYVVWREDAIYLAKSVDGGITFENRIRITDSPSAAGPCVAVDDGGNVFVVWHDYPSGNARTDIFFAKSSDGGESFSASYRVNDDPGYEAQRHPSIAVGEDGTIYVVWVDYRTIGHGGDIYFARSINSGLWFEQNLAITNDTFGQTNPDIAVRGNSVFIVWEDNRNTRTEAYFVKSADKGLSFTSESKIHNGINDSNQRAPSVALSSNGSVYIVSVWEKDVSDIYFIKTDDGGLTFTGEKIVNDDPYDSAHDSPSIACGPNGNVYVVWKDKRNGNPNIYFATSFDYGTTFSANIQVNDDNFGTASHHDPSIATDGNGIIHVVWSDTRNYGSRDIYYAKSDDKGITFGENVLVNVDSRTSWKDTAENYPSVAVDDQGVIYVVWQLGEKIFLAKSMNQGASFEYAVQVNTNTPLSGFSSYPHIVVDQTGTVYVTWQDIDDLRRRQIYFVKSSDGGQSFSSSIKVSDTIWQDPYYDWDGPGPSIVVDTTPNLYVIWEDYRNGNYDIYFAKSSDGGVSFSENMRVHEFVGTTDQLAPSATIDDEGVLYVIWRDNRNGGNWDVYMTKSTDGGSSFVNSTKVNLRQNYVPNRPGIAADSFGNLYAVWDIEEIGFSLEIIFAQSDDGGSSFHNYLHVNDNQTSQQRKPSIVANEDGIYIVWEDCRNGYYPYKPDIYFARTYTPTNEPPVARFSVDKTTVLVNHTVTFDASASTDDGGVEGYFYDFGDGSNSNWASLSMIGHQYTSTGVYDASLIVMDDLGVTSENLAKQTITVVEELPPTLLVTIETNPNTVRNGRASTITVQVTDGVNPVSDATVTLSLNMGTLLAQSGATDSNGHFTTTFTAPSVTTQTIIAITANATKTGYISGQDQTQITVNPKQSPSPEDTILWIYLAILIIVLVTILGVALVSRRRRKVASKAKEAPSTPNV